MAMDLCINEKDEERGSEAQSDVRAKKRAGEVGVGRREMKVSGRASSPSSFTEPRSLAVLLSRR